MIDKTKDTLIVASHPASPNAAYAACWDTESYHDDAMRFWREYEAKGAIVRRVDPETGKAMLDAYDGRGFR